MSKDENEKNYFQFPIAFLHHDKRLEDVSHEEKRQRLNEIQMHSVAYLAGTYDEDDEADRKRAERIEDMQDIICEGWDHAAILLAADTLGVRVTQLGQIETYDPDFGRKQVRLRADIFRDYQRYSKMSWREFAVLCSIYAAIGNKEMVPLSYDRIRSMAMGFTGTTEWKNLQSDDDKRLTWRKTQLTVGRLEERGCFVRASPNKKHNYYSHSLDTDELMEKVAEQEIKKKVRVQRAKRDRDLRERIEAEVEARCG